MRHETEQAIERLVELWKLGEDFNYTAELEDSFTKIEFTARPKEGFLSGTVGCHPDNKRSPRLTTLDAGFVLESTTVYDIREMAAALEAFSNAVAEIDGVAYLGRGLYEVAGPGIANAETLQ